MRCKFLEVSEHSLCYIFKVELLVNVQLCACLVGHDMAVNILHKPLFELAEIFNFHRQSSSIGMSSEVFEQVSATLYSLIDIKSSHASCRSRGYAVCYCHHHRWSEIDFCQS